MTVTLLQGDCIEMLKTIPDQSVQCVVTSPPYYGLRDYGTAKWEGGDPECEHKVRENAGNETSTLGGGKKTNGHQKEGFKNICPRCGAVRVDGQIGLEDSPELYVERLVAVFHEVKRVLKDDGTLWLNLGDSYWGGKGKSGYELPEEAEERRAKGETFQTSHNVPGSRSMRPTDGKHPIIKPKDLIGIPWMTSFALRADGWYLRSEIIWNKPNPMPESVTDRPTKSHEQIFLLSKSAKYYYDADAIKEPSKEPEDDRGARGNKKRFPTEMIAGIRSSGVYPMANKRTVWTVTTKPYKEAHFATFPPDLIEPCILAGSREGDTVLDPFSGSGTTCAVSVKHHRNCIGIDLNPKYIELARRRLNQVQPTLIPSREMA